MRHSALTIDAMRVSRFFSSRGNFYLWLGLISAVCLGFEQTMVAAEVGDSGFANLAKRAQPALLSLARTSGGEHKLETTGVFISGDGHALCSARAFSGEALPVILTSESKPIEVEAILAVYYEQALVLVKLTEHPREWLRLSERPVIIDSQVAFLHSGQLLPVHSGPVLSRRLGRAPSRPKMPLVSLLSIGTSAPKQQASGELTLHSGDPLIDDQNKICGVFHGVSQEGSQLLIEAAPLDTLYDEITAAIRKQSHKTIPFPLPQEVNPYDPASEKPAYHLAIAAMSEGLVDEALRQIDVLLEDHPTSAMVRLLQFDILLRGGRMKLLHNLLDQVLQPDNKVQFDRISLLFHKAWISEQEGNFDLAISAYEELVVLTPPEFTPPRKGLADCYLKKGDATRNASMWATAEKWYRAALASMPESIALLRNYQMTLVSLGKSDESAAITKRMTKLRQIYRR